MTNPGKNMAQTLIELREQKAKAEAKLEEAKQEWKAKEAKLKTKVAEINNAIFQLEYGFFAKMARRVAEADPKFMAAIEAEIERQHLDARVADAGADVAAREAKKQMKATVAATVQNSEKITSATAKAKT